MNSRKYPPRRKDLRKDHGFRVIVDIYRNNELTFDVDRFGSRKLFYEYFPNGRTKFGFMPNTGIIFPNAAEVIIRFILYCGRKNKEWKLRMKKKKEMKIKERMMKVKLLQSFR
jgi:hypothetical protein